MLNYKDLYDGFINIMDNIDGYSEDLLMVSQRWTNVFQKFYMNQIMPIPGVANPNLFLSLQMFQSGLVAAMKGQVVKQQFEILIQTLHLGVCTGVTMTGIYVTTPPTTPLKLQHCFNDKLSTKAIADLLAITIFTWIQPTFSVQISSGVIVKWM